MPEEVPEEGDDEELEEVPKEVPEEVKVRPLKRVRADSNKVSYKRKLFVPSVIQAVLRHADDP